MSYYALLQLDGFPGPYLQGKYRGAFKLQTASFGSHGQNSSPHSAGALREMDIFIALPVDRYAPELRWAFDKGKRFERAVLVWVTEGARGALVERARIEITDVSMEYFDFNYRTGDENPLLQITLHGTKPASR